MIVRFLTLLCTTLLLTAPINASADAPHSFSQAKKIAWDLYPAQTELYCGCKYSEHKVDSASCGYVPRKNATRASRIEWEHIVPAWTFGHQRQCWQSGGREHCESDDPVFQAMEADLFNLYPAVGEVNGDRSNFNYGMAAGVAPQYGQCKTKVDFSNRVAEPRDEVKGLVARTTFYMFDRYNLNMSRQQQQLLMAWDKQFPVTALEKERNKRIAAIMGHPNPFVTRDRTWTQGYKPVGDGVVNAIPTRASQPAKPTTIARSTSSGAIIGNSNSHVYHLPEGCPNYGSVASKNQMTFKSESEAQAAGYRKAGNCK
jgi:deoxyribonuclease-1